MSGAATPRPGEPPLPSGVRLATDGALRRLDIATPRASASVYFHGAHVAAWQPAHAREPVLWMSAASMFEPGKPIRGGVPICFPWFGPNAAHPDAPAHGFARLGEWALVAASSSAAGVDLAFALDGVPSPLWPTGLRLVHRVSVGDELRMTLEATNGSNADVSFEEALHTYLTVGSIERVTIAGLEGTDFLDKVGGVERRHQGAESIRFSGETDRVYLDTPRACSVEDPVLGRRIRVGKSGSRSTVVWNPWIAKAQRMPDFGDEEWTGMVCVETANVGDARVVLAPAASHTMTATIAVEDL